MKYKIKDINADSAFNSRGKILPIDVTDLAKDIEKGGLIQPVVVMEYSEPVDGKKYHLVAGFRRFTAHKVLGLDEIECKNIGEYNEEEARFINLNENLQRKDLTFMQQAEAVGKVIESMPSGRDASQQQVMDRLGQSRGWVQVRMMALKLPNEVRNELKREDFASQQDIRDMYSVFLSGDKEALTEMVKNIKDTKLRLMNKKVKKARSQVKPNKESKRHRRRNEIFQFQDHVRANFGNGIVTRTLAWCAGEITTGEYLETLEEYAKEKEINYKKMDCE